MYKTARINLIFLILIGILVGCKSSPPKVGKIGTLKGDLHYSFFRMGSFYDLPDSLYSKYLAYVDTASAQTIKNDRIMHYFKILEEHDLSFAPYIAIKGTNDSLYTVYFDDKDYQSFTQFTYRHLVDSNQKVQVKLEVSRLSDKQFYCYKVKSVKKVPGKTFRRSRKLKIEDYR